MSKNIHDFVKELQRGQFHNLYILEGEERYRKKEAIRFALKLMLETELPELNIQYLENPKLNDLIESAEMYPLMSNRRIVIVEGFSLLESKSKGSTAHESDAFIHFVENIPDTSVVIISFDGKADSRKNAAKACAKYIYTFDRFQPAEAVKWLIQEAKEGKKQMGSDTAEKILLAVGNDAAMLKNEMDKLLAYCAEQSEITAEAVDAITSKSISYSVFNMTDALLRGQIKAALQIMQTLIKNGENEYMLFAMLVRECRISYYMRALLSQGSKVDEIAKLLETKPFVVQKRMPFISKISVKRFLDAYRYSIKTELAIKEGKMSQEGLAQRSLIGIYTILYQ